MYIYRDAAVPIPLNTLSRFLPQPALNGIGIRSGYNSRIYNMDPITGGSIASGLIQDTPEGVICSTVDECIRLSLSMYIQTGCVISECV